MYMGAGKDINSLAKRIAEQATGTGPVPVEKPPAREKNPHAVALGRSGGLKGGKARMASMTPEERKKNARKAGRTRWKRAKEARLAKKAAERASRVPLDGGNDER
jgi:hypothetical protein